jgi:transcriptional regulator with XRE-family HTH domain
MLDPKTMAGETDIARDLKEQVGLELGRRRMAEDVSLHVLAKRQEVSAASSYRIESMKTNKTTDKIARQCDALGVLPVFFTMAEGESVTVTFENGSCRLTRTVSRTAS